MEERRYIGFDVDHGTGFFRVPADICEALHFLTDAIPMARGGRVQARALVSLVGRVISMKFAWGPVCQLYMRHVYALLDMHFVMA